MKQPQYDFHIHTKHLGCANETMEVPAIIKECERLGITAVGITDHLNTLDKLPLHNFIRQDIEQLESKIEVYFGVELNFTGCDQGFAFSAEIKEEYGFQFAIGGIHGSYLEEYDLKKLVDIQHRHHLKTCRDPLAQVLVHPYWFWQSEFDNHGWPRFDSMKAVPEAYARELAQTARDTGTAIEINACANLDHSAYSEKFINEYLDYFSIMAAEGAVFAFGSDAHDIHNLAHIHDAWRFAERLELAPNQIWRPDTKPFIPRQ